VGREVKYKTVPDLVRAYYKKYSQIPQRKYISDHCNISVKTAGQEIEKLKKAGVIKDNGKGGFYVDVPEEFEKKIEAFEKKNISRSGDPIIYALRIVLLVVGVLAACYSIYYTTIFLEKYLPFPLNFGLSLIMVVYSVSSFEVIIIFKQNKQYFLFTVFVLLWVVVAFYSIMSTVAGQYNARVMTKNQAIEQSKEVKNDIDKFALLKKEEATILIDYDFAKENYLDYRNQLKNIEEKDWEYWDTWKKTNGYKTKFEEKETELKNKRFEIKEFLESGKETGKTKKETIFFEERAGEIFNKSPETIAFGMGIFPAVFIDIIAPLAMAVSMFLRRKEERW